jgi:hypothetical protein
MKPLVNLGFTMDNQAARLLRVALEVQVLEFREEVVIVVIRVLLDLLAVMGLAVIQVQVELPVMLV